MLMHQYQRSAILVTLVTSSKDHWQCMLRREQYRSSMHFMVDFAVDLCTCCLQLVKFAQMLERNAGNGVLEMPRLPPACDADCQCNTSYRHLVPNPIGGLWEDKCSMDAGMDKHLLASAMHQTHTTS